MKRVFDWKMACEGVIAGLDYLGCVWHVGSSENK